MIFGLPFHVARFFRPTLLETFHLTNAELGDTFAFYGITAMLCYFPGGMIADYFSARRLLTVSLLSTALGGLYFAQFPQGLALTLLFGYWGITTIFLFWAGLIKATREWGGSRQGQAFGLLDGGRGMVAALMSSLAVVVFSHMLQTDNDLNVADKTHGIQAIIYLYTLATFIAAILIWWFIPEVKSQKSLNKHPWRRVSQAFSTLQVWLMAVIVICAYCGFKGADNYGLYAVQVLSMDHIDAAVFTSFAAYLRPVGAIGAGLLADHFGAGKVTKWSFFVMLTTYIALTIQWPDSFLLELALFNLVISFLAVFALRGVYFALLEESKVKRQITGTAVGIVSLIGYTPDIFFASVSGRILDAAPGAEGFENYFIFMMMIAALGIVVSIILNRKNLAKN